MDSSAVISQERPIIIWAVDPTHGPNDAKNIITELKIWAKRLNCDVQPVSVFSKSILNFPVKAIIPQNDITKSDADQYMELYMKKAHATGFLAPEILFSSSLSTRKMAFVFAKHAEKKKCEIIFANNRAKKSWNPFQLAGFAEALVAISRVPVLLLNPKSIPSSQVSPILFPTDFSKESKNALMNLIPWAKSFHSKVILFNQVESQTVYPYEFNGIWEPQVINSESLLKDVEKSHLKKANEWANYLKKENVNCVPLVQRDRKYIGTKIIEIAKKNKVGLIAITSLTGPASQAILGGIVRDVLLMSKCPVLIFYRPKAKANKKRSTKVKEPRFREDVGDLPQASLIQ